MRPLVGMFIRDFLKEHGESYASEIHQSYKDTYKGELSARRRKYRLGTYNSFATYIDKLVLAGLVERTGEVEESDNPKGAPLDYPERVLVRLSSKGESAPDYVWLHPLRLYYRPFDWERESYSDYIKVKRRRRRRST